MSVRASNSHHPQALRRSAKRSTRPDTLAAVSLPLPRFFADLERVRDAQKLALIAVEVGEETPPQSAPGATAAGDWARLRGLPAIGRGCAGAIRGTDPAGEVLRRESRRR